MAPSPLELESGKVDGESEDETRERIAKRFEKVGNRLMNRTRGSADFHADPIAAVLMDPQKRSLAAQLLGEAFVIAHNLMRNNKEAVDKIAAALMEKKEIFGDELVRLLDSQHLKQPEIDWTKDEAWPQI
jgi:hypothetical protein